MSLSPTPLTPARAFKWLAAFVILVAVFGGLSYLYFYPGTYSPPQTAIHSLNITVPTASAQPLIEQPKAQPGKIAIDRRHNNSFSEAEVESLLAALLARGQEIVWLRVDASAANITNATDFNASLANVSGLVVISPKSAFNESELATVKDFIKTRRLLLIADPERPSETNSVAISLGFLFQAGYLWNLNRNDGNYRFIYIENFNTSRVTENLSQLVLYTACSIAPEAETLARTSFDTYLSSAEIPAAWPVLGLKGNVLAMCDQTWLQQPSILKADNSRLLGNIADWLVFG